MRQLLNYLLEDKHDIIVFYVLKSNINTKHYDKSKDFKLNSNQMFSSSRHSRKTSLVKKNQPQDFFRREQQVQLCTYLWTQTNNSHSVARFKNGLFMIHTFHCLALKNDFLWSMRDNVLEGAWIWLYWQKIKMFMSGNVFLASYLHIIE